MKSALFRSSGSDSEQSPVVDLEAVLVSLSNSERSQALATVDVVLVSFVLHRCIGLELTLTIPDNPVQISSGSIGAFLSQDNLMNQYPLFQPFHSWTVVVLRCIPVLFGKPWTDSKRSSA